MECKMLGIILLFGAMDIIVAEPDCHMVEVQVCFDYMANYINSLSKRTIPRTKGDITVMCGEIDNAFSCWNNFKKRCMTPIQTEIESIVIEGARDLKDRFCTPDSDLSSKYVKHAECLEEFVASDTATTIINRILVMFERFDMVPDLKKIRYVCCGWNKMFSAIKQSSSDTCGEEATESAIELLTIAISSLPNVLCEGFDPESEGCQKILPREGLEPTGRQNPFVNRLRYYFKNHLD